MNYKNIGAIVTIVAVILLGSVAVSGIVATAVYSSLEGRLDYQYMKDRTVVIIGESEDIEILDNSLFPLSKLKKTMGWLGTGVIVKIDKDYTYILTNAHVAGRGREGVTLAVKENNKYRLAKIIKYHQNLDMAIIRVVGKLTGKKAITDINTAKIQEKVYVVGHPLGNEYVYGEGVIAGWKGLWQYVQVPCMPGNSGSGVFNAEGDLVAIIFAIDGTAMGMFPLMDVAHAIAVDGTEILDFLKETKVWVTEKED